MKITNIIETLSEYWNRWRITAGFSPELWSGVSFVLPLVVVPMAIKGAKMAYTAAKPHVKKAIEEYKKKKR